MKDGKRMKRCERAHEQFHALAQSASDAIITINADGNVIFWNKAAEKIFGFKENEMVGNSLGKLLPEEFQQTILRESNV